MIRKIYPLLVMVCVLFAGTSGANAAFTWKTNAEVFTGGPPYAKVCGKTEGTVYRAELMTMKGIQLGGCVSTAQVQSFKMSIVRTAKDGSEEVVEMITEGSSLSGEMKGVIKGIASGSKVYFEDIKVEDGTGKPYDIKPVVVTIG